MHVERGDEEGDGVSRRVAVLADDQLSFPSLGPNLELASVLFAAARSVFACRCGGGDFWWFDSNRTPHCLGPSVCGVVKSRVSLLVYERPSGEVEFARKAWPVDSAAAPATAPAAATAATATATTDCFRELYLETRHCYQWM